MLDSRQRWIKEEIQGAWLRLAWLLYLVHLSPLEVIPTKSRGSYTDQKCWCQGFYKVPAMNTKEEGVNWNAVLIIHTPTQPHSRWTFGCKSTLKCQFSTFICSVVYISGKCIWTCPVASCLWLNMKSNFKNIHSFIPPSLHPFIHSTVCAQGNLGPVLKTNKNLHPCFQVVREGDK